MWGVKIGFRVLFVLVREKSCSGFGISQRDRVGEDTFEMYLRYRYINGCIFWIAGKNFT